MKRSQLERGRIIDTYKLDSKYGDMQACVVDRDGELKIEIHRMVSMIVAPGSSIGGDYTCL